MSLTFENIQDAIEKEDPSLEAISATLSEMHEGLTVKFAQHYHDDWAADYYAQGGVQQTPSNQYSELLEINTTLYPEEQQRLYDTHIGPSREALEGIVERVKEHFTRSQTALREISARYWDEAQDLEDSYSATHQDTVKQKLQYWSGPAAALVKENFADPLGTAYENHRDMLKELSNAVALDLALLKKGQLYAQEIVNQASASLTGSSESSGGNGTAALVLTAFAGITTVLSAGAGAPLAAVLWAGASASSSVAGALTSMGTHSEHKFSDIDGLQLVADVHSAFDELDAMLNSERDSAVSAVREAFESKYKSKLNGDPTMSSTVIPNINGYQL